MQFRKIILWLLGVSVGAVIIYMSSSWWSRASQQTYRLDAMVRPAKIMVVGNPEKLGSRAFPGRAEPTREVLLSFRVAGPLIDFPVMVGQKVHKGELIARIDPRDYDVYVRDLNSQLKQVEAKLKMMKAGARPEEVKNLEAALEVTQAKLQDARDTFTRVQSLYEKQAISKAEHEKASSGYDVAKAQMESARQNLIVAKSGARTEDVEMMDAQIESIQAKLQSANNALSDTNLRAPFAGIISSKLVENFQTIAAGQPVVMLVDQSQIEVAVDIPEDAIHYRPYVTKVMVSFQTLPGKEYEASIKEVSTVASAQTLAYPVTVIMPNPPESEIYPGMTAEVKFTVKLPEKSKATGLDVPGTAVFQEKNGETLVWVFNPNTQTVSKRKVATGVLTSYGIKITSGLETGEQIVTAGVHFLVEGQKVRVWEK